MSDIPEDVLKAAYEEIGTVDELGAVGVIARAIMTERERCAKICEEECAKRLDSDYPMERRHDFIVSVRAVQKAIRGTSNP